MNSQQIKLNAGTLFCSEETKRPLQPVHEWLGMRMQSGCKKQRQQGTWPLLFYTTAALECACVCVCWCDSLNESLDDRNMPKPSGDHQRLQTTPHRYTAHRSKMERRETESTRALGRHTQRESTRTRTCTRAARTHTHVHMPTGKQTQ